MPKLYHKMSQYSIKVIIESWMRHKFSWGEILTRCATRFWICQKARSYFTDFPIWLLRENHQGAQSLTRSRCSYDQWSKVTHWCWNISNWIEYLGFGECFWCHLSWPEQQPWSQPSPKSWWWFKPHPAWSSYHCSSFWYFIQPFKE